MGIHFYDASTDSLDTQKFRLQPASATSQTGIPCVVWAEDALSFVHFVPTALFTLQLIVPDESLQDVAQTITASLPYTRSLLPLPDCCEFSFVDRAMPNCFPHSIVLRRDPPMAENDPKNILLHPRSYFPYDISDNDSSISLESFPSTIRFPTRPAFFDLLIGTILDPPLGFRHQRLHLTLMTYLSYLLTYTLRNEPRVQPNGELEAEHASVLSSVRVENRPFLETLIRNTPAEWLDAVRTRREILVKLGREVEGRPFPRMFRTAQRNHISAGSFQSRQYSTMSYNTALSGVSAFRRLFRRI